MELGILILIILGSFIFKKDKPTAEDQGKPVPTKDMTWEEMEEYYGITLSRDSKEPEKMGPHRYARNTSESVGDAYDPVDVKPYETPTYTDTYEEPVTVAHRAAYEGTEEPRKAQHKEEVRDVVREVVPSQHRASRKESLRSAARHGMVWSMILETPKGARMLGRYRR